MEVVHRMPAADLAAALSTPSANLEEPMAEAAATYEAAEERLHCMIARVTGGGEVNKHAFQQARAKVRADLAAAKVLRLTWPRPQGLQAGFPTRGAGRQPRGIHGAIPHRDARTSRLAGQRQERSCPAEGATRAHEIARARNEPIVA
jgi:hypothetical protein